MSEDAVTQYYLQQARGSSAIGPYYVRSYGVQSGRGFGSFLSSIFRWFQPILKSGAKAVGREALKTGSSILADLGSGSGQKPLEVIKQRAREGTKRLQSKLMTGEGIGQMRRKRVVPSCQSTAVKGKRKAVKRKAVRAKSKKSSKKQKLHRDIFS